QGLRGWNLDQLPAVDADGRDDLFWSQVNMSSQTLENAPVRIPGLAGVKRVVMAVVPFAIIAAVWQFASLFFPPYLFPSLVDVFWRCLDILGDWRAFSDVLATAGRILAGLAGAFVIGRVLG